MRLAARERDRERAGRREPAATAGTASCTSNVDITLDMIVVSF
jgi:hypothetical protein